MRLKRLSLTQFRVFEQAEFEFRPGMNLLVGVNGVGKSSVLDAIAILLSQIMPKFTASKSRPRSFSIDDIMVGRGALTAQIDFTVGLGGLGPLFPKGEEEKFTYLVHQPREKYVANTARSGKVRGQVTEQFERSELAPSENRIPKNVRIAREQPIAVYFSPHRSLYTMKVPSSEKSAGGQATAFADALAPTRELRVREYAQWLLTRESLAKEEGSSQYRGYLRSFKNTVTGFLDSVTDVRAVSDSEVTLAVDKDGSTLNVRQLSDGERGMLALAFDLTRRLSQANPESKNPLKEGKGVVLIDELDLHLHPRWQREIVEKLTTTFPNCQFIATTHSPQIVGEVPPQSIILLEVGKPPYRPDQSLGMDTNWILRHLMEVEERNSSATKEIQRVEALIEKQQYAKATVAIDSLRNEYGEFPELVRLQTRIDRMRLLSK